MEIERYRELEDSALVERVLKGDHRAFERLFDRHREDILRMLTTRCCSSQDASDLLQETFIKVFINISRYDKRHPFGAWVYTIARNTFVDFKRRSHEDLSIDERHTSYQATSPNPEESVINSQQTTHIEESLSRLSPTHQTLFRMRFMEEYSYDEIAEKLSMPLGSVKTNIHRARAKMCQYILEAEQV